MAAIATIEQLQSAKKDLDALHKSDPKAYDAWVGLLKAHRAIGYKNIAKLAMGSTPDELKE